MIDLFTTRHTACIMVDVLHSAGFELFMYPMYQQPQWLWLLITMHNSVVTKNFDQIYPYQEDTTAKIPPIIRNALHSIIPSIKTIMLGVNFFSHMNDLVVVAEN